MVKEKRKIKEKLKDFYMCMCRLFCGVKNRAVFASFSQRTYSDNPKALSEKLHELDPKIEIVWLFQNPNEKKHIVPDYVKCVNGRHLLEVFKLLATSKCVVNNCTFQKIKKGRKQFFVQLWHGDRAFKKILHDVAAAPKTFCLAEEEEGFCDLAVAGSDYGVMQYRSAFRYKGEILKVGIPRNDMLLNHDQQTVERIRKSLNIAENKRIVLYAPTLRAKNASEKTLQATQDINFEKTLAKLKELTGEEWMFLIRSHPSVLGIDGLEENENVVEVSKYEDMADLLLISDVLITDYSSSAGDFVLLRRPIVLFQSDYDEYVGKDRELYFDITESPYFVAKSQEELEEVLANLTPEEAAKNCDEILAFYGTNETGHSSEFVAKRIIAEMYGGKKR